MHIESPGPLSDRCVLVTGITDASSLALPIAREIRHQGGRLVCTGLGPRHAPATASERARDHLQMAFERFRKTVETELGGDVPALDCDVSSDESLAELGDTLAQLDLRVGGVVHAVAFDRTIRGDDSPLLIDTPRDAFLECMNVSAYSLIALTRALLRSDRLADAPSIVALSYIGAERSVSHPYRNVAVAKAALERIVAELAIELGRSHAARVNAVRFSPWSASRAGGAIPGLGDAESQADARSPLGNATPESLALEVAHLLRRGLSVTGEVRHVDGGYHVLA